MWGVYSLWKLLQERKMSNEFLYSFFSGLEEPVMGTIPTALHIYVPCSYKSLTINAPIPQTSITYFNYSTDSKNTFLAQTDSLVKELWQ